MVRESCRRDLGGVFVASFVPPPSSIGSSIGTKRSVADDASTSDVSLCSVRKKMKMSYPLCVSINDKEIIKALGGRFEGAPKFEWSVDDDNVNYQNNLFDR